MKLLVFMRDGRTVYKLTGRKNLARLVGVEPWHEGDSIFAVKGVWNPITGEYVWAERTHLRFLAKGSISHVEEDHAPAVAAA